MRCIQRKLLPLKCRVLLSSSVCWYQTCQNKKDFQLKYVLLSIFHLRAWRLLTCIQLCRDSSVTKYFCSRFFFQDVFQKYFYRVLSQLKSILKSLRDLYEALLFEQENCNACWGLLTFGGSLGNQLNTHPATC